MNTLAPSFLIGSSSYLQVTRTSITSRTSSKFGYIGQRTAELPALERLENSSYTYYGKNLVNTLAPSFLNRSSLFLQVTRTCMKDTTTDPRVICPCASEKLMYNVVNTLAPPFLIGLW